MSGPQIPNNTANANPTLQDLMAAVKENTMISTNCHAIGTIQSVALNSLNGLLTATVTINYSRTYYVRQATGAYVAQQQAYPTIVDAPIVVLGGGTTSISFPIAKGDQCVVLFNDRDMNNWFAGAMSGPVASTRLHAFADAMVLVGFQKLAALPAAHATLTNGNAQVAIPSGSGGHVRIANNTTTLYTLLAQLIAAIEAITMSPGSFQVTVPSTPGTYPVSGTSGTPSSTSALEAAKTALQGLLE